MERGPVFIGIDVSKAHLDVAVLSSGETWQEPNDEAGIAHLVGRVRALGPTLVVLEATGGLEMPAACALGLEDVPVAVVNPRQVRDFAKSLGLLAKTDSWTPRSLPSLPSGCAPHRGPCPMSRRKSSPLCWQGGASSSRCARWRRTG